MGILSAIPSNVAEDATSLLVYVGEPFVTVDWEIASGDGSLTVLNEHTDVQGRAAALYTPGTLGSSVVVQVTAGT